MILLAFRHGLRAGEIVDLRWEQVDFNGAALHVLRIKNGSPSTHPLTGRELRALRKHLRESSRSPFVFVSERGASVIWYRLAFSASRKRSQDGVPATTNLMPMLGRTFMGPSVTRLRIGRILALAEWRAAFSG